MCQVNQDKLQLNIVKDFQSNLINFVNGIENIAVSTQNLAKIISHVDPNQSIVNKSVPALLDWGQNLFMLAERFEVDFKSQLSSLNLEKEVIQPEAARITMDNIYEKVLFFLNHMCHSFVDYSRSESPMSGASNFGDQSLASGPPPATLQKFKLIQQQQQYRRWSEAAATMEQHESNIIDANRRWSMPTNVSKTRLIPKSLAGLVVQQQQQQMQAASSPQPDPSTSDGINEAIQLLSFRPSIPSRPPSQQNHPPPPTQQQSSSSFQYAPPPTRNSTTTPSQTRQRQSRGELNEILILPRVSGDAPPPLGFLGTLSE